MRADVRFLNQTKEFWAHVRSISQELGYTNRKNKTILIPGRVELRKAFEKLSLSMKHIEDEHGKLTDFGATLYDYFTFRSEILTSIVRHNLMSKRTAKQLFDEMRDKLEPQCPLPFNKQKGEKRSYAFLTGLVNMIIEANIENHPCNYDPRSLTTVTRDKMPLRTLSRRVDGAFPSIINPIAIWEIKEYYYTTTFGSRVADGVYESLLDGMELEELEQAGHRKIYHLLIIDDYYTWWECGRSYLCRIIDMLHMGYLDEVIFGREIVTRLPEVVRDWKESLLNREKL